MLAGLYMWRNDAHDEARAYFRAGAELKGSRAMHAPLLEAWEQMETSLGRDDDAAVVSAQLQELQESLRSPRPWKLAASVPAEVATLADQSADGTLPAVPEGDQSAGGPAELTERQRVERDDARRSEAWAQAAAMPHGGATAHRADAEDGGAAAAPDALAGEGADGVPAGATLPADDAAVLGFSDAAPGAQEFTEAGYCYDEDGQVQYYDATQVYAEPQGSAAMWEDQARNDDGASPLDAVQQRTSIAEQIGEHDAMPDAPATTGPSDLHGAGEVEASGASSSARDSATGQAVRSWDAEASASTAEPDGVGSSRDGGSSPLAASEVPHSTALADDAAAASAAGVDGPAATRAALIEGGEQAALGDAASIEQRSNA